MDLSYCYSSSCWSSSRGRTSFFFRSSAGDSRRLLSPFPSPATGGRRSSSSTWLRLHTKSRRRHDGLCVSASREEEGEGGGEGSGKAKAKAKAKGGGRRRLEQVTEAEPQAVAAAMEAFAPATVANLGPGFDFLGCAVEGLGDVVKAEICSETGAGEVRMGRIEGDGGGRLSMEAERNCAGIAGKATMEMLGVRKVGVRLSLRKGLPLGSGLGSSAASAAAAAMAVNELFGGVLSKEQLVMAGMEAEAQVSGRHADNVAPSLLGGFVLVSSYSPLRLVKLPYPDRSELFFVLVSPDFEAPTKEMRSVLPRSISLAEHVANCSQAAALVSAILTGDLALLGLSISSDSIVEPLRSPLIPGMSHVKRSALLAGALGCTISGSGPTAVAIADSRAEGLLIADAMVSSFSRHGNLAATAHVQRLNRIGATITSL